jgi:Ras homolog gene family, member A
MDIDYLRDMDQPFIFEARNKKGGYRLEFYDTSSPENWRLLEPDMVIICYDISQRLSLINMQRVVSGSFFFPKATQAASRFRVDVVASGSKRSARPSSQNPNCLFWCWA